jgi:hypothetical protein
MLQFTDAAGYTWYFNHLISFIVLTVALLWACKQELSGHKDKFLHVSVSAGLTLLFIWLLPFIHIAWWFSSIIVLVIGACKELYDYYHPKTHTCDIKDFMADAIGVGAITIFYLCSFVLYRD